MRRVGIIGTGDIAKAHALGYQTAGASIVAVCDVDESMLARRKQEWSVERAYTNYEDLLADPEVEVVSICTPNSMHHPITVAAAKAGKHVLCEKPVSLDLAQGEEMIRACDNAGVVFQVGHHLRSWIAAARAKTMIDRGDIGRVVSVRFRQSHDWGGRDRVRGVFGSKAHSGGGTLLDNGCHLFDLSRFFAGDALDVHARIATLKFDVEVEDTAVATLGFASGAIGTIEVAWTATGFQEGFWIHGTEGSLECDSRNGSNVLVHRFRTPGSPFGSATDVARYELNGLPAHSLHVANFLAAVDGTRDVICTGRDGWEAVRLVLGAYESAASGRPVVVGAR